MLLYIEETRIFRSASWRKKIKPRMAMDKTTKIATAVAIAAALLFPTISVLAGAGQPAENNQAEQSR